MSQPDSAEATTGARGDQAPSARADVGLLELSGPLAKALAEAEALASQRETRAAVARLTGATVLPPAGRDAHDAGEDDSEYALPEGHGRSSARAAQTSPATNPTASERQIGPVIRGIPAEDGATAALRMRNEALNAKLAVEESARARAETDAATARADLKATRGRFQRAADQQVELQRRLDRAESDLPARTTRNLLMQLLPALDAQYAVFRGLDSSAALTPDVVNAMEMVRADWQRTLASIGVVAFDAEGTRFDPAVHEAISTVVADGVAPGTVARQVGRGYLYEGRLLRCAQVVVGEAAGDDPDS